jgi:Ca-activated chloride channel family protein
MLLMILVLFTLEAYSQVDRKYVRKGNGDYKEGEYQQAEVEYRKALEKNPESYKADFNLGNALYKQKQYDAAAAKYAGLAEKENDRQKLNLYYYNLGNTMYEKQKYQESIDAYKNALRNTPGDLDAKHNLQLALKMLHEQQQQQQQNKDDQQQNKDQQDKDKNGNNDQQNKDQQNQDQQNKDQQQNQNSQSADQPQKAKGQISPEDAERILQALENEEKDVMKRVQERKERAQKVQVDKNW